MSTTRIFAYGTLMTGFGNNTVLPQPYRVLKAEAPGKIYGAGIPFYCAHETPLAVGSASFALDLDRERRKDIRMLRPTPETPDWVKGELFEFDGMEMGEYALRRCDRLEGWSQPFPFEVPSQHWGGYRRALIRVWPKGKSRPVKAWAYITDPALADPADQIPGGDFRKEERLWEAKITRYTSVKLPRRAEASVYEGIYSID